MPRIVKGWYRGPWKKDHSQYWKRDKIVAKIGFASYRDYLRSELWTGIRDRVLSQAKKCRCCKESAPQCVHHHTYTKQNLSGRTLANLVALCNECHRAIEYNGRKKRQESHSVFRAFQVRREQFEAERLRTAAKLVE